MNKLRIPVACFTASLFLILVQPTQADVRYMHERCNFILEGTITAADVEKFTSTPCKREDVPKIWIQSSPGGDAEAAMAIGRWARERRASVFLHWESICYSSCALVYIAGVHRAGFGELGLHRPYLAGSPGTPVEVEARVNRMVASIRSYVEEMGITPDFTHVMLNTPPGQMRRYKGEELWALVPAVDPLVDEINVASAARRYGISTEEYRRRSAEAEQCRRPYDPNDLQSVLDSYDHECSGAIMWGLSRSVYRARHSILDERCKHLDIKSEEEWEVWQSETGRFRFNHPEMHAYFECRSYVMLGR